MNMIFFLIQASSFTGPGMRSGAARGDPDLASDLPEMETFEVELVKDQQGLGITIAGYVCEKGRCLFFFLSYSESAAKEITNVQHLGNKKSVKVFLSYMHVLVF